MSAVSNKYQVRIKFVFRENVYLYNNDIKNISDFLYNLNKDQDVNLLTKIGLNEPHFVRRDSGICGSQNYLTKTVSKACVDTKHNESVVWFRFYNSSNGEDQWTFEEFDAFIDAFKELLDVYSSSDFLDSKTIELSVE